MSSGGGSGGTAARDTCSIKQQDHSSGPLGTSGDVPSYRANTVVEIDCEIKQ